MRHVFNVYMAEPLAGQEAPAIPPEDPSEVFTVRYHRACVCAESEDEAIAAVKQEGRTHRGLLPANIEYLGCLRTDEDTDGLNGNAVFSFGAVSDSFLEWKGCEPVPTLQEAMEAFAYE